jgi:hypothetical protein
MVSSFSVNNRAITVHKRLHADCSLTFQAVAKTGDIDNKRIVGRIAA